MRLKNVNLSQRKNKLYIKFYGVFSPIDLIFFSWIMNSIPPRYRPDTSENVIKNLKSHFPNQDPKGSWIWLKNSIPQLYFTY